MKIAIVALYFEMLDVVLNNIDNLCDVTIAGITFQDKQKNIQFKRRFSTAIDEYENISDIFYTENVEEIWIFSNKIKETDLEKDYIGNIIELCKENKKRYRYIVPNQPLKNEIRTDKKIIILYHDIINPNYINIELYYKKALNTFGLSAKIINIPNEINSVFGFCDYPLGKNLNQIKMDVIEEQILKAPEEVIILGIPYDLSSLISQNSYYVFYALLSSLFASDYSIVCLNAETCSNSQIGILTRMCETFFGNIDDYFVSAYGRKMNKSYSDEPERIIKYNKCEINNNVNRLKGMTDSIRFINLEGYAGSFKRFREKLDISIRPYTVII